MRVFCTRKKQERVIDFSTLMEEGSTLFIKKCDPIVLATQGRSHKINMESIQNLANHLQVNIENRSLIYDLNLPVP